MTRRAGLAASLVASVALFASRVAAAEDGDRGAELAPTGPPPPPLAQDQSPPPVTERPAALEPMHKVTVGPDIGVMARPATGNGPIHYGPSLVAGGHIRIEALDWLGLRIVTHYEHNSVKFDGGSLPVDGASLRAPSFHRVVFGLSLEPTWVVGERFLTYFGAGARWARTTSDFSETDDLSHTDPTGVFVEFPLVIGTSVQLVKDWLVLETSAQVSLLTGQNGSLFNTKRLTQAFDQNGRLLHLQPFPKFGTSFGAVAGLAVLL